MKNKNCKLILQNLCKDFCVALPVETPWMFTLFPLKQRKFNVWNLETPSRSQVSSKNKPGASLSVVAN